MALDGKTMRDVEGPEQPDPCSQRRPSSRGAPPHPKKVDTKTNEIPCVRPVFDELEIKGKVITADALLTQKAIAEYLVTDREADCVFTVSRATSPP